MTADVDVIQPSVGGSRPWSELPASGLRLNGVLRPASVSPVPLSGKNVEIGTLVDPLGGRATLCLVPPGDRATVVEQLTTRRELLTETVFVVVRGAEPALLSAPLREAESWATNAAQLHALPAQGVADVRLPGGGVLRTIIMQTFVPLDAERILLVAATSPALDLVEPLIELFDAVTSTLLVLPDAGETT